MGFPVIDTHCHILPKMDDGSKSSEESLKMLHEMKKQGVDIAIATSHYYKKHQSIEDFLRCRAASAAALSKVLDGECPRVKPGAEVAFYFGISDDPDIEKLCFAGTRTLLLEMPKRNVWTDYEISEVENLVLDRGLDVIIAHYERYKDVQKDGDAYKRILQLPVYIQINAESLEGFFAGRENLKLFKEGRAHLLGSDAHNMDDRLPNLAAGREIILKKLGQEKLDEIDKTAAGLCLGDAYKE